uniref:Uncharacterized protein n=1 Tax=Glossina morsitans morsitans TaxID=37546 RepID=A0A1B0FCF9_GLOMM
MSTRYPAVEVTCDKLSAKDLKGPVRSKTHRFQTRVKFEASYKQEKHNIYFPGNATRKRFSSLSKISSNERQIVELQSSKN